MVIKCICINCEFYLNCWINKALVNFPKYYNELTKIKKDLLLKPNVNSLLFLPTTLLIQLNINSIHYKSEPDIIFCDSFVEKPGKWIIRN